MIKPGSAILFYDGNCQFCNLAVRYIIRNDSEKQITIKPLNSKYAIRHPEITKIALSHDTVILQHNNTLFINSDVIIETGRILGGRFHLLTWLRVIPKPIRDSLYRFIARNRKKMFRQKKYCEIHQAQNQQTTIEIKSIKIIQLPVKQDHRNVVL